MKALGIVPGVSVEIKSERVKAEVACTFADGRVLVLGRYYHYSEVTVLEPATTAQPTDSAESKEALEGAIAISVSAMLPEILADDIPVLDDDEPAPTPAQMAAYGEKIAELLEALKDAQSEIERLTAENLKLHEANDNLLRRDCRFQG